MKFKNMKIGVKLGLSFFVMIILMSVIMGFSISNMRKISNTSHKLYSEPHTYFVDVSEIYSEVLLTGNYIRNAVMSKDYDKYEKQINDSGKSRETAMNDLMVETSKNNKDLSDYIDQMNLSLQALKVERDKVMEFAKDSNYSKAQDVLFNEYTVQFDKTSALVSKVKDEMQLLSKSYDNSVLSLTNSTIIIMDAIFFIILVVAISVGYITSKSIVKPVKELKAAADKLSMGNLDIDIEYTTENEIGQLANSLRNTIKTLRGYIYDISGLLGRMADGDMTVEVEAEYVGDFAQIKTSLIGINNSLNKTLSHIENTSIQVARGSEQLSMSSQNLSTGASEQTSAIEELSATAEEITSKIHDTSNNAAKAMVLSDEAAGKLMIGNKQMEELVTAMNEISKESKEIEKIIKAIDDIAFQTNILALNASVEAARAGANGKGFAVVADEVRNLANKSADAVKNTSVLIEGSAKAVNTGKKIADETAHTLSEVVVAAQKTVSLINFIAGTSKEEFEAISQFSVGIDQISNVVSMNSATAEESAASSQELAQHAQLLKELVSKFNLNNEDKVLGYND